jgi:D-alanyl-D-alanine carboxypeptidase/D-alanyl-D-alanine-endopeptidase (penicillin-binding protein 4)
VKLLSHMANSELWTPYWESLPEAGNRRELGRMYRTAAAGNLRAKTGTINGVSALSGVVQSTTGERIAFSIIGNHVPSTWSAKRVEDRLGIRLATFDRPLLPLDGVLDEALPSEAEPLPTQIVDRAEGIEASAPSSAAR